MQDLLPSLGPVGGFAAFIIGFGFIIFVHELGHFLVAKAVGIKVTQFALGFGQAVATYRKGIGYRLGSTEPEYGQRIREHLPAEERALLDEKDKDGQERKITPQREREVAQQLGLSETEYRLNWMPLGGYVKMLGQEDLNPDAVSDDPRSFNAKPVWARACVVSAGVIMNLIFALIFFIVAFEMGVPLPPAVAGLIDPELPAATAYAQGHDGEAAYRGLQPGDVITKIDNSTASDFIQLSAEAALADPDQTLKLTVQRDGAELFYRLKPVTAPGSGLLTIGIEPPHEGRLDKAPDDDKSPLYKAGLTKDFIKPDAGKNAVGAHLVAADGKPISTFGEYCRAVMAAHGNPVTVTFADDKGKKIDVTVAADPLLNAGGEGAPRTLAGLVRAARVEEVVAGSPAEKAGIKAGDYIAQYGPAIWPTFERLSTLTAESHNQPMALAVSRDGKRVQLDPVVTDRKNRIGVELRADEPVLGVTLPDSPAAALDLPAGSRILSIDGKPVKDWTDMQRVLAEAAGRLPATGGDVSIGYRLNLAGKIEAERSIHLTADDAKRLETAAWFPPAELTSLFAARKDRQVAKNPLDACMMGIEKTHHFMLQTYVTLRRLFQRSVPLSELHGPVVIAYVGTQAAQHGGTAFLLFFLGLLSVNLAVMNFLPIPIVDGGLMVFLIIEKIKGSPVSLKIQNAVNYVGLAMIATVFLVTFFHDISWLIH